MTLKFQERFAPLFPWFTEAECAHLFHKRDTAQIQNLALVFSRMEKPQVLAAKSFLFSLKYHGQNRPVSTQAERPH